MTTCEGSKNWGEYKKESQNNILNLVSDYLSETPVQITSSTVLDLRSLRQSPSPASDATKPKYQLVSASGTLYFKFGLTDNEICAEIVSAILADILAVPVAKTCLAYYKNTLGVVSEDINVYEEPEDSDSYTALDFIHIPGFAEMCLFDYE